MVSPLNGSRLISPDPALPGALLSCASSAEAALPESEASDSLVMLQGRLYRVRCVDGVEPLQVSRPGSPRQQYIYDRKEVAHFSVGECRYVLVPEESNDDSQTDKATPTRDPRSLLTSREMQIVQLICMGLLTKQVADRLHLSEFTVRSYLKTIYCKLGVRSRGGMVYAFAKAFGLSVDSISKGG
jgi:DNA-binding CsgD family transcriptional regulator